VVIRPWGATPMPQDSIFERWLDREKRITSFTDELEMHDVGHPADPSGRFSSAPGAIRYDCHECGWFIVRWM
jgi:hypothetical protein